MTSWRLIYEPGSDVADLLAYPSALMEGRHAGKYLLSGARMPDTMVILGFRRKGIAAGADVEIDRTAASREGIDVAISPRMGRRGPQPVGTLSLQELTMRASRRFKSVDADIDTPAVLLYTSGTTGKPRGVMLSHRNFHAQCHNIVERLLELTEKDRIVGVLPLYHVYGLANGLISSVCFGGALALVPQYTPSSLLSAITDSGATLLIAVPSMYMHLLNLARTRKASIPRTLRLCISGGAPLPRQTMAEFEQVFQTRINEGYGLTETTSAVCMNASGPDFKTGSIGRPAEGVRMKIIDENGNEMPTGKVGEIVISGDVVTSGYWRNTQATAEQIRDGWLYTGDLGYRDNDGCFFITDRSKDLIIRGGFNISPREIEEVICKYEGVADTAVIGVPDKRGEETIKAFIMAKHGIHITEHQIIEHCRSNLASYKTPRKIEFVDIIPRSATGKVLRRELREGVDERKLHAPEPHDV